MNNYYKLVVLFIFTSTCYAQEISGNLYVDKAWVNEYEVWSDFDYEGQIVVSPITEEGSLRISNYDFLFDFCEGKAKFSNKQSYTVAEFSHPRKIKTTTDKQGIVNSTYEGTLIFQNDKDYYSVIAVVTILEKNSVLGLKMHLKDKSKEYAFTFKPSN
ncbi:hypothetical protein LNQ49_10990 [Flavobacterium sp. F-65]|uniref:Lipocalin-like domain-containing protein n=1 Tax=Flavobacterium pisciphilum TaxID=2893755 RepID=A0ABS8MW62_9FLAO|nr:hypothetical protein [Flavobacterium sp. F-65]MCC9072105.1 hypothetical protein [Flavobacterium sp. F-65]